ncbi:MAG: alpha/beta fold hydrolase, partial [Gammaproteobacteria bacterium]|nr:alpha/beta fold hydrolase [Gammaproteobacteria bacterium]
MIKKYIGIFVYFLISFVAFHAPDIFAKEITSKQLGYISYTEEGKGEPLILIHAFPTDQRLWQAQRAGLNKYFHVITLDLWGFGSSSSTNGQAVTMIEFADEVKQLLRQLHIQKAIIGGESMGGYVALAFLQRYPESVAGLILSDTQSIADSAEVKKKRELVAETVLTQGPAQLINDFMPKALSPNAPLALRQSLRDILDGQSVTGMASALRGMGLREDTSKVLAATSLPILILTGDQDTVIAPQQSQYMHTLARNSRLVTITNAGHLSSLEQPEQW